MLITVPYSIRLQGYTSSIATSGDWSPNSVLVTKVAALCHLFVYDLAFAIRRIERLVFHNFIENIHHVIQWYVFAIEGKVEND